MSRAELTRTNLLLEVEKVRRLRKALRSRSNSEAVRLIIDERLEGVALNHLINVAVAKKVSALRTEEYFRERGRRSNRAETLRILELAGRGNPPLEGDALPQEWQEKPSRKTASSAGTLTRRTRKKRT